jgi:uncharacterized protein YjiS (DUF1127 family)
MPVRALNSARKGTPFRLGRRVQALAVLACARLLRWHELSRQRRALLALSHHMLKDIGITRGEAEREGRRPFWSDGSTYGTVPALTLQSAGARRRQPDQRLPEALIRLVHDCRQTAALHGVRPLAAAEDGDRNADAERHRQQKQCPEYVIAKTHRRHSPRHDLHIVTVQSILRK